MESEKLISIFLKGVWTKEEALKKFDILEDFLLKKFFSSEEKSLPPELKDLPKNFFDYFSKENAPSLLEKMEAKIEKIEPLVIYLPFSPSKREIEKIGNFIKKKIRKDIILEFREDKSLIGGCALAWKGLYKDFSIRGELKQKRKKIYEIFSQYLKKKKWKK